jgi:hypothetical protein
MRRTIGVQRRGDILDDRPIIWQIDLERDSSSSIGRVGRIRGGGDRCTSRTATTTGLRVRITRYAARVRVGVQAKGQR